MMNKEPTRGKKRTRAITQSSQNKEISYVESYLKLQRQEISTAIISKEEEEVFASLYENSNRAFYKKTCENAWNFAKKKRRQL